MKTTTKTILLIGLTDKDTLTQLMDDINFYINIVANTFSPLNCTITKAQGCYTMHSNGMLVQENTIKVELYNLENSKQFDIDVLDKIHYIKTVFNQESILIEHSQVELELI